MKTLRLFVLGLLLFPTIGFSQSDLPSKGDKMIELNATPFNKDGVFSINGLQAKYWWSDNIVLRLGLELDTNGDKWSEDDFAPNEKIKTSGKQNSTLFGIRPGIEYRILKDSKISPYGGFELSYRKNSASTVYSITQRHANNSYENFTTTTDVDGAMTSINEGMMTYSNRAFNAFGANAILGSDFYFGFELGLSYQNIKYSKVSERETQFNHNRDYLTNIINTTVSPSLKTNKLSFYANSAIRVGVWF